MCVVDRKSGNPLGAAALLLRGFSSVKPLLPAESVHLRVLVACRLVASSVMGAYSRQFVSASTLFFLSNLSWDGDVLKML